MLLSVSRAQTAVGKLLGSVNKSSERTDTRTTVLVSEVAWWSQIEGFKQLAVGNPKQLLKSDSKSDSASSFRLLYIFRSLRGTKK